MYVCMYGLLLVSKYVCLLRWLANPCCRFLLQIQSQSVFIMQLFWVDLRLFGRELIIWYDHQFEQGEFTQTLSHNDMIGCYHNHQWLPNSSFYTISHTRVRSTCGLVFSHFPMMQDAGIISSFWYCEEVISLIYQL